VETLIIYTTNVCNDNLESLEYVTLHCHDLAVVKVREGSGAQIGGSAPHPALRLRPSPGEI